MGVSGLLTFLRDGRNFLSTTEVLTSTLRAVTTDSDDTAGPVHFEAEFEAGREEISLVIDGWAFIWSLYNDNLPWATGGEYHAFALLIERVIIAWDRLGIRPYFVFDGPTPSNKHDLVVLRFASALRTSQLFHLTSPSSRSLPRFLRSSSILPPLIFSCTLTTLQDLGLQTGTQVFVLPEGEADGYCVSLASELGGWVLSNDTDEVILGSGTGGQGYRGFIPIDLMQWTMDAEMDGPNGSAPGGHKVLEDDGFSAVTTSRKKKRSGPYFDQVSSPPSIATQFAEHLLPPNISVTTIPNQKYKLSLTLTSFHPTDLARRLRIPATHLPLLASLLGTDHSPAEAPNLFFEHSAARAVRIERVAHVIRECIDPKSAAHKKARVGKSGSGLGPQHGLTIPSGGKGSVITHWEEVALAAGAGSLTAKSSPSLVAREEPPVTAGDHAYEFIRLAILNLLLRPLPNEDTLDRLVTGMIDATCHYILPPSPTRLGLDLETLRHEELSRSITSTSLTRTGSCCATYPFCTCVDSEGGVAIWTCRCYSDSSEGSPTTTRLSCSPHRHDRIRTRYALARNAGHMSALSAFREPDRSYLPSVLENPDGMTLRMSDHSRRMRRLAWEIAARGMGLFGSRGDLREAVHDDESETDIAAEDVPAPELQDGDPHVVWEYMRAGSSVKIDTFPLYLRLDEASADLDDLLQSAPIEALEQSYADRWGILCRVCETDGREIVALPSGVQLLIMTLRICVVRAANACQARATARLWTHGQLVRCLIAGLESLQLWSSSERESPAGQSFLGDTTEDGLLILETAATSLISQVAAVSFDLLYLGQALLLVHLESEQQAEHSMEHHNVGNRFRPHSFQQGSIWHRVLSCPDLPPQRDAEKEALLVGCFKAISRGLDDKILGWDPAVRRERSRKKSPAEGGGEKPGGASSFMVERRQKGSLAAKSGIRGKYDLLAGL